MRPSHHMLMPMQSKLPQDVLFGRGSHINTHPGNERFRWLVEEQKQKFANAEKRKEKRAIAMAIMDRVRDLMPPGRFLEEGSDDRAANGGDRAEVDGGEIHPLILAKSWVPADENRALGKTLHRLRERPSGHIFERRPKELAVPDGNDEIGSRSSSDGGERKTQEQDEQTATTADETQDGEKEQEKGDGPGQGRTVTAVGEIPEALPEIKTNGAAGIAGNGGPAQESDPLTIDFGCVQDECGESVHNLSLRQWIAKSKQTKAPFPQQPSAQVLEYVESALPTALKLTEYLMNADVDGNNIPLECISAEFVWVRAKEWHLPYLEVIDSVLIAGYIGGDEDKGGLMPRLFALGVTFCELFSGGEPLFEDGCNATSDALSMNAMNLNEESKGPRPKKSQRQSPCTGVISSKFMSKLESSGVPHALISVLKNLLDCYSSEFRGDDAYTSLSDLRDDLVSMSEDPSRFLRDIQTNPMPSLEICDKLYGREEAANKLEHSFQQHFDGRCCGVVISGGAGVGKTKLANHVLRDLANQFNGYLVAAKFNSNEATPLFTIGSAINSICDLFVADATPAQLELVKTELETSLGNQAPLLASIVPSLPKLLPSSTGLGAVPSCVDSALSMQYLCCALLRIITCHSRRVLLLLDDLQWADPASLNLASSLILYSSKSVFCTFLHRDDISNGCITFNAWLHSITTLPAMTTIKIENLTPGDVGRLVSDSLHRSCRITRPLTSSLYRKCGGNPLFLRQLMESLVKQNLIFVSLNPPQWSWDLDGISGLEISDNVLSLLIKEMQRLDPRSQLGLKVASCVGFCVQDSILRILSEDLGMDLEEILEQIVNRGFMNNVGGVFQFAHDKIRQAAYELMTAQQRQRDHMQFGCALLAAREREMNGQDKDELFFTAINQINLGGASVVHDRTHLVEISGMNLDAGRRAISLYSDYNAAFRLFRQGISFLPSDNHWTTDYTLSLHLYDAAAEAACITNNQEFSVYSDQLLEHARCFEDKFNCLYSKSKELLHTNSSKESIECMVEILVQMDEKLPRKIDLIDEREFNDMNERLQKMSDDDVLSMTKAKKREDNLLKLYANLTNALYGADHSLIPCVSLRMVDLTIKNGLSGASALAFAFYGEVLTSIGSITEGCRLARLALKLVGKNSNKSEVIRVVYSTILWASEPLQSIVDAHALGKRAGQQSGDYLSTMLNWYLFNQTSFAAGLHTLDILQKNYEGFISKIKGPHFLGPTILVHCQIRVLREGLNVLNSVGGHFIPTERELLADPQYLPDNPMIVLGKKINELVRAILFRQFDDISFDTADIWDSVCGKKELLRIFLIIGIFFEGLVSYKLARQRNEFKEQWIAKGDSILASMKCWSEHSLWNWENKMLLLEAERLHTLGTYDEASRLYEKAIVSAREHKFIHEEAIASDLAGEFFLQGGLRQQALDYLVHSVECYRKWGAIAVAKRVEVIIANDSSLKLMKPNNGHIFASEIDPRRKRQERE
ncbi:hypothetical protein ACHAWF_018812 [Thalassiosira exigua]